MDQNIQVDSSKQKKNNLIVFLCFTTNYLGEWNEDGQRHGLGQLIFHDNAKYRGRFENGLFSGLGSISYPDGSKYINKC